MLTTSVFVTRILRKFAREKSCKIFSRHSGPGLVGPGRCLGGGDGRDLRDRVGMAGDGDVPGPGDQSVCEHHQPGHNIAKCVMFCKTQRERERERENSLTCDCDLRRRSFGEMINDNK